MLRNDIIRLLRSAAAVLVVTALAACGPATTGTTAGQSAPPDEGTLARGNVLSREQIQRIHANTMLQLMEGRFAGLQVARVGGQPRMLIRGEADPLVILDGTPLADPQGIWTLNPNDLEQVEIMKGDQAVLYGSRGGRGVVKITTRLR